MKYTKTVKKAPLVLASAMLLSTVLAGCGGTVTPSSGGTVFRPTSGISVPSADSLGENGELIQRADVTTEQVLANGIAVQEESVALDSAGLPAKIVTSAYLSGAVLDAANNGAASAQSGKLGSGQADLLLAALQASFPAAANASLAYDSQDVVPVTLTYEYGNVSTVRNADPKSTYALYSYTEGNFGHYDGVLMSFTLSFSSANTADAAAGDTASGEGDSNVWITYITHADNPLNHTGEWTSSDPALLDKLAKSNFGDTVLAMGDAAQADVADLVGEYGYSVGEPTGENMSPTVVISSTNSSSPWVITKAWHAKDTETSLTNPNTPSRSVCSFVFMDSKKVRASDSTVLLSLTRTVRAWLANGTAAQVTLYYTYRSGKLYSVEVTAERATSASFGMYDYNGGTDLFVVNKNGDLVRTSSISAGSGAAETAGLDDADDLDDASGSLTGNALGGGTLSGASLAGGALGDGDTISGDTASEGNVTPVLTMYWTALTGKSSPTDADIIAYIRRAETDALQGLQNADDFVDKVYPNSQ